MANHKSAIKRAKQSEVRRLRNKNYKTRIKTAVKEVKSAIAGKSIEQAEESLKKAVSIIQKTAGKSIIHKKTAARKVSCLTRLVNQLRAT